MKVAVVVQVYRGCLDSVEVFLTTGKARKRYEELLKEYGLTEENMADSDYCINLEPELIVQGTPRIEV